jgi:8-oxo-dGTP diphosphatase
MSPIRCACLVDRQGSKLLLVRVRQNEHWYLPGGKIGQHESAESALQRELTEELGIDLSPQSIHYLYSVVGPAYGHPGDVELICFSAQWAGDPRAHGEISEVQWLDYRDDSKLAPAVKLLCRQYLLGECASAQAPRGNEA